MARLGGDEFVVLVEDLDSPTIAEQIARKLIDTLAEGISLPVGCLAVTTSIGLAYRDDAVVSGDELMKLADDALYAAKAGGRTRPHRARDRSLRRSRHGAQLLEQSDSPPGDRARSSRGARRRRIREAYVRRVAGGKARTGLKMLGDATGAVVLGADTEVVLDDDVSESPPTQPTQPSCSPPVRTRASRVVGGAVRQCRAPRIRVE